MKTTASVLVTLGVVIGVGPAVAQESTRWQTYDPGRAMLRDSTVYEPYHVTETVPLRDALRRGTIVDETLVAVLERNGWQLGFVIPQLLYHHAAQGKRNGEPWLVSF